MCKVLRERDSFTVEVLLRFGAWKGNEEKKGFGLQVNLSKGCIVEFKVETDSGASQSGLTWNMRLVMEGWCLLNCQVGLTN